MIGNAFKYRALSSIHSGFEFIIGPRGQKQFKLKKSLELLFSVKLNFNISKEAYWPKTKKLAGEICQFLVLLHFIKLFAKLTTDKRKI